MSRVVSRESLPGIRSSRVDVDELAARLRRGRARTLELINRGEFSDLRSEEDRRKGSAVLIPEDEVHIAECEGMDALARYRTWKKATERQRWGEVYRRVWGGSPDEEATE